MALKILPKLTPSGMVACRIPAEHREHQHECGSSRSRFRFKEDQMTTVFATDYS